MSLVAPGVARAYAPGDLDYTFGIGGKAISPFVTTLSDAHGMTLQSDGKTVVVGGTSAGGGGSSDAIVLRYKSDGILDSTFSGDGMLSTDFGASESYAGVAVQPDGKVVTVGTNSTITNIILARYTSAGVLDNTFDGDGRATITLAGKTVVTASEVAVLSDGKLLLAGYVDSDIAILRVNSNGSLDTSFDADGYAVANLGMTARGFSMTLQADGKIVVAGDAYTNGNWNQAQAAVVRFNSNGSLDTTFDGDGMQTFTFGGTSQTLYSSTVQSDGRIVVAGGATSGGADDIAVARFNSNGSLDTTFGGDGKITVDVAGGSDGSSGVTMHPDGKKIYVAGYAGTGGYSDAVVARINGNGSLDTSFSSDGIAIQDVRSQSDFAQSMVVQSDGKVVLAGYTDYSTRTDVFVMRFQSQNSVVAPAASAPASVTYAPRNTSVVIEWTATAGTPEYVVTANDGTVVCITTSTICTINGLQNGVAATYLVYGRNADGVQSASSGSVAVRAGFQVKTTTVKAKKSLKLSSIATTPSLGRQTWRSLSGGCRVVGGTLVAPTKKGTCQVKLSVAKKGSYPAMSTTIAVSVS